MAELRIPIIGEFKGKKAFDDAGKATGKLDDSVKKLGKALLAAFSVQKITQFSKAAVKAFVEDEAAASRLAQSVKNLGLAFETPAIEAFIEQLSRASGVTDTQLRPAMQRLLQTTGSLAKSTELMNLALEISRGSGIDYETVVNDLSMAYVGQTRGLRKYSLGLSAAELQTMSFTQIQEKLNKTFTGANAAYLETYAGKLTLIQTAAGEAQETIGKGLVDAFAILASDTGDITELTSAMNDFAEGTATAFKNVAILVSNLDKAMQAGMGVIGMLDKLTNSNFVKIFGGVLGLLSTKSDGGAVGLSNTPGMGGYPSSALGPGYVDPNQAKRDKSEKDAAKRNKELANLQKKTLDTQKKANALTKAAKTIDLDRISVTAALRGKISETDRISLNLQLALLDKNETQANKLAGELSEAVKRQNALNAALIATPEAPNPYRNWKVPTLDFGGNLLGSPVPNFIPPAYTMPPMFGQQGGLPAGVVAGVNPEPVVNVIVTLDSGVVTDAVSSVQTNNNLSGSFTTVGGRGSNTARFT